MRKLCARSRVLLVVDVGDPLEEEQRENVRLEVGRIHRPAQNVGGFPQMCFKLSQRQAGFDVVLKRVLNGRWRLLPAPFFLRHGLSLR